MVTFRADEGDAKVADGGGEGASEGLDGGAKGLHGRQMSGRLEREVGVMSLPRRDLSALERK